MGFRLAAACISLQPLLTETFKEWASLVCMERPTVPWSFHESKEATLWELGNQPLNELFVNLMHKFCKKDWQLAKSISRAAYPQSARGQGWTANISHTFFTQRTPLITLSSLWTNSRHVFIYYIWWLVRFARERIKYKLFFRLLFSKIGTDKSRCQHIQTQNFEYCPRSKQMSKVKKNAPP